MNKIGWCSETYNPVIGCKNNCSYCYARKINQRFKFIKDWNNPEWREKSFNRKFPKRPQRIFVGSMSEIYYWKQEWIERAIEKVKQYPQHTFQFLTKFPEVYNNWVFPKNCWLGVTITKEKDFARGMPYGFICAPNTTFLCIEPMLDRIDPGLLYAMDIDWLILGAETGNRKGKVIPNGSWVFNILDFCNRTNTPLFIKDNLVKYHSEFGGYKQFPAINKL